MNNPYDNIAPEDIIRMKEESDMNICKECGGGREIPKYSEEDDTVEFTPCPKCNQMKDMLLTNEEKQYIKRVTSIWACGSCEYMYPNEAGRADCACLGEVPQHCFHNKGDTETEMLKAQVDKCLLKFKEIVGEMTVVNGQGVIDWIESMKITLGIWQEPIYNRKAQLHHSQQEILEKINEL